MPSEIQLRTRYRNIGVAAIVDDDLYDALAAHHWHLQRAGYARTKIDGQEVFMHRLILGLSRGDGIQTDHINRNKLDNRRENLRFATPAENAQNRVRAHAKTSRYRGVSRTKHGLWFVQAKLGGRTFYLGTFLDEEEAARVASDWRSKHMPFSDDARAVA